MFDLDLMDRFRQDMPPADPAAMARARARMFRSPTAARTRRRWVWGLAPVGALAAAVAVGAVALRPHDPPTPPSALSTTPAEPADGPHMLRLAAAEARQEPELKARPDQYVYVESRVAGAGLLVQKNGVKYAPPVEKIRQIWQSVDGSPTGLLREKNVKTGKVGTYPLVNEDAPNSRMPIPYRTDLPTEVPAMRAYLYSEKPDKNDKTAPGADTMAFRKVGDLLRESYLPPNSAAALFEAAATIPGTSLTKRADLSGRTGTAVSRTEKGLSYDLIFDASTHKFMGERTVVVGDIAPLNKKSMYPENGVINWTAQFKIAIVDRPGQLP